MQKRLITQAYLVLFCILALNVALWSASRHVRAKWGGVPPAPSEKTAASMTLSDRQFAYRVGALTLQNIGDTGGRSTAFKYYDYNKLKAWFNVLLKLDKTSDHVPMAAAFYFGAIPSGKEQIQIIVDYLAEVGQNTDEDKWRWLAHAIYLARYKLDDIDQAFELSLILSEMEPIGDALPLWAKQMHVFIRKARGEKEAARSLLEALLLTDPNLSPNERNFVRSYLVEQLDVPEDQIGGSLMTVPK